MGLQSMIVISTALQTTELSSLYRLLSLYSKPFVLHTIAGFEQVVSWLLDFSALYLLSMLALSTR
jgi:hypothetical protein